MRAADTEYWVLIDPKKNIWKQVEEAEARFYSAVETRLRYAIPRSALGDLYGTKGK